MSEPSAVDDPLARLAEQLERLSSANLALSEAAEQLIVHAREERIGLRAAAREAKTAARTAAEASARAHSAAGDQPG